MRGLRSIRETDRKALRIGVLTVSAYIASYVMRNVLTVVSPFMLSDGYVKEYLAALSSVYMLSYAVGQFFGGFVGDMVRPKGMVITGFFSAALGAFAFTLLPQGMGQKLCFVFIGAGLIASWLFIPAAAFIANIIFVRKRSGKNAFIRREP